MKNTHDPLDDKLKDRLGNYTEEPGDALWSGIASNIESVEAKPVWVKPVLWSASVIVVLFIALLIYRSADTAGERNPVASKAVKKESPFPAVENSNDSESNKDDDQERNITQTDDVSHQELSHNDKRIARKDQAQRERSSPRKPVPGDREQTESSTESKEQTAADRVIDRILAPGKTSKEEPDDSVVSTDRLNEQPISGVEGKDEMVSIEPDRTVNGERKSGVDQVIKGDSNKQIVHSPSVQTAAIDSTSNLKPELSQQAKDVEAEKEEKHKSDKKLSLYFTAMPTFGYNRVEANKSDNVMIESVAKVSNFSTKRLGVRAEFGAEYAISGRTRIFAGLLYYQRKQTIDYVEKRAMEAIPESIGDSIVYDPQYSIENKKFEYELKNIGLQLGINYLLKEGKFLHSAGTGIEFHKALNKLPEESNLEFGSNPSTYVFYNLYYRIQYPARGKLKAVFQPAFNYSLYLNQDMNAPFYVKPYGLGLNLGVTYSF